jgi:hypothetical protein
MAPKKVYHEDWKKIQETCDHKWTRPECTKYYTKETIDAYVTAAEVHDKIECYEYENPAGRAERYFILMCGGQKVAVRGITNASFVYFHYYMADVAVQHRCSFDDSYYSAISSEFLS